MLSLAQLETEQALLIPKAQKALSRYGHQVVVGNDLHKRKFEVVLVEQEESAGAPPQFKETWLRLAELQDLKRQQGADSQAVEGLEIEEMIVAQLVKRHDAWLQRS
jgi:phosphopantothenate-cysteine ligase